MQELPSSARPSGGFSQLASKRLQRRTVDIYNSSLHSRLDLSVFLSSFNDCPAPSVPIAIFFSHSVQFFGEG
jgi:hypothetical protein